MPNVLSTLRQDHLNELPVELLLKIFSKIDGPPYWPELLLVCNGWGNLVEDSKNLKSLEGIRTPIEEMTVVLEVSKFMSRARVVFNQLYAMPPISGFNSSALTIHLDSQTLIKDTFFEYVEESLRKHDIAKFTLISPDLFTEDVLARLSEVLENCPLIPLISFQWLLTLGGNVSTATLCSFAKATGSLSNCPPSIINDDFLKAKAGGRGGHNMTVTAGLSIPEAYQPIDAENLLSFKEFTNKFSVSSLPQLIAAANRRNGPLDWTLSISETEEDLRLIPRLEEIHHLFGFPSSFEMDEDDMDFRIWIEFRVDRYRAKLTKH